MVKVTNSAVKKIIKNNPSSLINQGEGYSKNVYAFKNKALNNKVLLIDKNIAYVLNRKDYDVTPKFLQCEYERFKEKQLLVNFINENKIRVPKLYSYFYASKKYHEIQEKMYGENFIERIECSYEKYFKNKYSSPDDIPEFLLYSFFNKTLKQYEKKFEKLINVPTEQFLQFFTMLQNGYNLFKQDLFADFHCGNVMYSKKHGFSFIDLPLDALCERFIYEKDNGEIEIKTFVNEEKPEIKQMVAELAFHCFKALDPEIFLMNGARYFYSINDKIEMDKYGNLHKQFLCKLAVSLHKFGVDEKSIHICCERHTNYFDDEIEQMINSEILKNNNKAKTTKLK